MNKNNYSKKDFLNFLIPSIIGLILFIIPLPYGKLFKMEDLSSINIGIGFLAELMKIILHDYMNAITLIIIITSAVLSIIFKFIKTENEFLTKVFDVSPFWLIFRVISAIFIIMIHFNIGLNIVISEDTGQVILGIMPSLISIFLVSSFLLPLILDFGLMDFFGTLISRFMKTLFKVPGRAAIDTLSSWLGDGTLGIMITSTQYKEGYYTKKESIIIATCFSLVSLPFSTVIADQLGFMDKFVLFYSVVCIASLICALILPRIYPISKISDDTYNNILYKEEVISNEIPLLKQGLYNAIKKAKQAPKLSNIISSGFKNVLDIYMSLIPLVLAWGIISLIIAEFTPIFNWISYPIIYILEILNIPNAIECAPAILIGITDMFIPSVMVSGDNIAQISKFIIGTLSISQLIYMTETGAVILKSDIPLNLKDLIVIFLLRTIISLCVIIPIAHMLF